MAIYNINVGLFSFPAESEDKTTNVLSLPAIDEITSSFNLTFSSETLGANENLHAYVNRQLLSLEELGGYKMLKRATRKIDSLQAEEIEFVWISEGTKIAQRQAYVVHENKALIFTGTMTDEFKQHSNEVWEKVLSTFNFRKKSE